MNSIKQDATVFENDEVHIWTISPKEITDADLLEKFKRIISVDEYKKINRYRLESAKHSALITRAFIRTLLSQYENKAPQDWVFTHSDLGKPEIENSTIGLRFNLSHNKNLIICAVCLNHDIGCDIESLSRKMSIIPIANRFFCKKEATSIKALPENLQRKAFFEYWTLKESFVKATGKGISQGLDTFHFEFDVNKDCSFRNNINLYTENKSKVDCQWFNALIYPDEEHVIGISVKTPHAMKIKLKERMSF